MKRIKWKKLICFLSCTMVFVLAFLFSASAAGRRSVKVGYKENYGTISSYGSSSLKGYGYDYLEKVSRYANWQCEYKQFSWENGIKALQEGKIDIFGPMQKTKEREDQFLYPDINFGYEYGVISTLASSKLDYEDFSSFDGIKIGAVSNNFYIPLLEKYAKDNNFKYELVYMVGDLAEIDKCLHNGTIDAYLSGSLLHVNNSKIVAKMSAQPFYYAVRKGGEDILSEMNSAMVRIEQDDIYFPTNLHNKYYGDVGLGRVAFTKEEMAYIKSHPTIRVGYDSDVSPIQYYNAKTKSADGIFKVILSEISKECYIEFDYVPIDYDNYDVKDYDVFANYQKNAIKDDIDTTLNYHEIPMLFVATKPQDVSANLNVGMLSFDTIDMERVKKKYGHYNFKIYSGVSELRKALFNDELDFIITTLYSYDSMVRDSNGINFLSFPADLTLSLNMGVSDYADQNEMLLKVLDKAISRVPSSTIETMIFADTINRKNDISFEKMVSENAMIIIFFAVLILFLLVGFIVLLNISNKKNQEFLTEIAYVDDVTGLPSLRKFKIDVTEKLQTAEPNEYMLVGLDVENFKYINDAFGYEVGNKILKMVAEQAMNIASSGTICTRITADNFLFFSKAASMVKVYQICSDAQSSTNMEKVYELLGKSYNLVISVGMYTIDDTKKDLTTMIDYANIAKKTVKGYYGIQVANFTEAMCTDLYRQREITLAMESALIGNEFLLFIQPKHLLKNSKLGGGEVLVRWKSSKMGFMPPMDFIPLFEKNGFIQKLDLYMFENTCKLIDSWQQSGKKNIPLLSVNVSKISLDNEALADTFVAITKKYNVSPQQLELELTEGILIQNVEQIFKMLKKLKAVGFYISLDDFGSGFSSLNILKDMPVDIIKIDKEFLSGSIDTDKGRVIVSSIINLSKGLSLITVAEGVETALQADSLKEMGCDIAQGYFFAKPMPWREFEKLI